MVDTSKLHASIESLGRRSAKERLAFFLAEQHARMAAVGLAVTGRPAPFNITQTDLADATGLSLVHVNKTIKKLKDDGLISWTRGQIIILNWDGLVTAALFNGDYLHFKHEILDKPLSGLATVSSP